MLTALAALFVLGQDIPQYPPHYAAEAMTCPVGGEAFQGPALMHYSTFGSLPDGQPVGSIAFPILLPECPGNGLPIYGEFTPADVAKLTPLLASDAYKAMRGSESAYYRAYWLAAALGQDQAPWLLLAASWEAKNAKDTARAKRYMEAFVALVRKQPPNDGDFVSIVLRARAVNTLRELERFEEAETLRATITIAPNAGGSDEDAAQSRKSWAALVAKLAAPIARRDAGRMPIDLLSDEQAASRCLDPEYSAGDAEVPPLSAFEADYCKDPKLGKMIAQAREYRR